MLRTHLNTVVGCLALCATVFLCTRLARADEQPDGEPFGPAVNVGLPINTFSAEGEPFVSPDWPADGSKLYFFRESSGMDVVLYEATWRSLDAPRFLRGDCNEDGSVS